MKVGFIGLGLMGTPMATRLLNAGHTLTVFNRSRERAEGLLRSGAQWQASPQLVARNADVVVTMLSNSEALEHVALGEEGILSGLVPGSVHVDCSTVAPSTTRSLAATYLARGVHFLHAPVLGSVPQATDGSLLLFVGGEARGLQKAEPVLKSIGGRIWRFDNAEQASTVKLTCNFFIAGMITTLAEGIVFLKQSAIDPGKFLEILSHSALNAPMFQTKGASMIAENFAPRFFVEHMLKDINLLLDSSKASSAHLPTAEMAQRLFRQATEMGLGREDYSAVIKVFESARDQQ